jgi:hypothetical protein
LASLARLAFPAATGDDTEAWERNAAGRTDSPPTIDGGMISGVLRRVCVLVKLVPVMELPVVAAALLAAGSVAVDVPDVVLLLMMTPLVELLWPLLAAAPERVLLLVLPAADELLDEAPLPIGLP